MGNYKPWKNTLEINLDDICSLKFCLQLWEKIFLFLSDLVCGSLLWKQTIPTLINTPAQYHHSNSSKDENIWKHPACLRKGRLLLWKKWSLPFLWEWGKQNENWGEYWCENTWEFVKGMMHSWQEKKGNLFPSLYACPLPNASTGWNSQEMPPLMKYFIKSFHLFQWQWLNVSHLDVEDRSSVLGIGRRIICCNSILVRKDHVWV
jgi:hypothetical protein